MRTPKHIAVVCALIIEKGKLLSVQHGQGSKHPGKWEFPGGKVHPGESPKVAIVREIMEELGIRVEILTLLEPVEYEYPDKTVRLIPYVCRPGVGAIVLHEHQAFSWVDPEAIGQYDLLPADTELLKTGGNFRVLMKMSRDQY